MSTLSANNSLPSLWTPQFDPRAVKVELPELAEPPSDTFLRSILQRKHQPLSAAFNLKVHVHGIYSVPELWKAKMVSRRQLMAVTTFCFKNNRTIPPRLTIAMSAELSISTSRALRSWPVR